MGDTTLNWAQEHLGDDRRLSSAGGDPEKAARLSTRRGLLVVTIAYAIVFGSLLWFTNGRPYVFDNNESYCSLDHAYNLLHFDFFKSCGLTDDVCSPHAEAHPYVHTHQGNFPRIFAAAIYLLGAREIESQIVVTTLTIGLASILMTYFFFARHIGALFATIACLFLMTDYVMYAQWQVVTYRVWHGFFIFSTLLCVDGLGSRHRRRWQVLTFVNFACIFYWEFVFAAFTAFVAITYAAMLYLPRIRRVLGAMVPGAAGALCAVTLLLVQLVAYMGVDGVLFDARATITARNAAADSGAGLKEFYDSHNILFWENFFPGQDYRTTGHFARSIFGYSMGAYTPFVNLLVWIVVCGVLLAGWIEIIRRRWASRFQSAARLLRAKSYLRRGALGLLLGGWVFFFLSLGHDLSFIGIGGETVSRWSPTTFAGFRLWGLSLLAGVVAFVSISRCLTRCWFDMSGVPVWRLFAALTFLTGVALFIRLQPRAYEQAFTPIWTHLAATWGVRIALRVVIAVVTAMAVGGFLDAAKIPLSRRAIVALSRFLVAGFLAYACVYVLSTGYIYTGYLVRWNPLLTFFSNPMIGIAAYVMLSAARNEYPAVLEAIRDCRRRSLVKVQIGKVIGATVELPIGKMMGAIPFGAFSLTCALLAGYWCHAQYTYLRLLPPDHFGFVERLRDDPFHGQSFAVNSYSAPISWATGEWSYFDPAITHDSIVFRKQGYEFLRDAEKYVWLADRRTNTAYQRPRFVLVLEHQTLATAIHRFNAIRGGIPYSSAVDQTPLLLNARRGEPRMFEHRIMAEDPTRWHRWAILELDWTPTIRDAAIGNISPDPAPTPIPNTLALDVKNSGFATN